MAWISWVCRLARFLSTSVWRLFLSLSAITSNSFSFLEFDDFFLIFKFWLAEPGCFEIDLAVSWEAKFRF